MRRLFIFILLLISGGSSGYAKTPSEISFWGSGGLLSPYFKLNEGKYVMQPGAALGVSYTYFFNSHWGLGFGAEASLLRSSTKADKLSFSYTAEAMAVPDQGDEINRFDFKAIYENYRETQQFIGLNIPVTLQYRPSGNGFTGTIGFVVGLPIKTTAHIKATRLSTSGYFPYEGIEYTDLPQHGFGTFENYSDKRNLNTKIHFDITAEVGYRWKLSCNNSLYTTVFASYGITPIFSSVHNKPLLQYMPSGSLEQNGIWETDIIKSKNIIPVCAGIKLRYAFSIGR